LLHPGLKPKHVECDAFKAELRQIEGQPADAEITQKDSLTIQKGIRKDLVSQVQLTKSAIVLIALIKNKSLPISALMEEADEANRSRFRNNILNPLIEIQLADSEKLVRLCLANTITLSLLDF